jgi:hypothetical protein
LLQEDTAERRKYAEAARYVLGKHRCLEQLAVPDCRMSGCTLRFWETQYDVLVQPDMMTSPHGWSSWKVYAAWYLYLLTGEEDYLRDAMNTLGACVQLMDAETGVLRWAFVPDPFVRASAWEEDADNPGQGLRVERIVGEQYIDMISGWWKTPADVLTGGYWGQGGCCDNDVHEVFKCVEEVALTSAYVIERADGDVVTWNCRAEKSGDGLTVDPAEEIVDSVHVNLRRTRDVRVRLAGAEPITRRVEGMQWIRRTGGGLDG